MHYKFLIASENGDGDGDGDNADDNEDDILVLLV